MKDNSTTSLVSRASLLINSRQYDEAIRLLRQSLATSPQDAFAHALLSLGLCETEQLKEATKHAEQAIAADPELALGYVALSSSLYARNRFEEAHDQIRHAIRLDPEDSGHHALKAQILFSMHDWYGALAAAEKGLQIQPDDDVCTNLQAMALRQLRQKSAAEECIRENLARDPENAISHANLGWSLLEQGQVKESLRHFQEALRLDPDSAFAREGLIHALRSHFFIYRWLFAYFSWISFSGRNMWVILLGGYIGYRFLRGLSRANPALASFIWPLTTAYVLFALSTWLVEPLTNLLLLTNQYGRHALRREQKVVTAAVAACLCLGIALVGAYWFWGRSLPIQSMALGFMIGLLSLPVSGSIHCERGWPRNLALGIIGILLLMVLAMSVGTFNRLRDGSGVPPQRGTTMAELQAQADRLSKVQGDARGEELRKINLENAARDKLHKQQIADWERKTFSGWEWQLFSVYTTLCLLAQFAVIGLQAARVRL